MRQGISGWRCHGTPPLLNISGQITVKVSQVATRTGNMEGEGVRLLVDHNQ